MLYGFDKKIKEFKILAENGRLAQSYIFFGDPQIGKAAFARHLAFFLETGEFIVTSRTLVDFLEVSPIAGKDFIGIESAAEIKGFLSEKTFSSLRRTVIVPEAERLTDEAQAALLKIVEEPPADSLIILILPDPNFLIMPLASRCQKIYFSRLSRKEIEEILIGDHKIGAAAAKKAAEDSFGRLGRALALVGYNDKEPLKDYFSEKILAGRKKMPVSSGKMAWLLDREAALRRFNLNAGLQQRAAEEYLTNN